MASTSTLPISIDFSGGAELLCGNVKQHSVQLPKEAYAGGDAPAWTLKRLIIWVRDNLIKEKPELFIMDGTVRPGILVLVNDTDWELLGCLDYELQPNDRVTFISTLHGG